MLFFCKCVAGILLSCAVFSCTNAKGVDLPNNVTVSLTGGALAGAGGGGTSAEAANVLAAIAEAERSRRWQAGLALRESTIRERDGDYAGAVFAAFKELLFAYSTNPDPKKSGPSTICTAMDRVREAYTANSSALKLSDEQKTIISLSVDCVKYFVNADYDAAFDLLRKLFANDTEFDSFPRWMSLVCVLEDSSLGDNSDDNSIWGNAKDAHAMYSAIRARYELFPAYWYFAARNMSDLLASEYAERCINSAPQGPFAAESREILAAFTGLSNSDGHALLSKSEIETLVVKAVNENDPDVLSAMLPLLSLNDNPYTLYASGAMRSLAVMSNFKEWFVSQEKIAGRGFSETRLLDRLKFIARG